MPQRKHNRCRICVYPRVLGLPLGICILTVITVIFSVIAALAVKSLGAVFFAAAYLCGIYIINIFFAGNFGWSKKRQRHTDVKTGVYMAKIERELKLHKNEKEN